MALEENHNQPRSVQSKTHPIYSLAVLAFCAATSACVHKAQTTPPSQKPQITVPSVPVKAPDVGEVCRPDVFKDGETIKTSVGEIKVKGWKLLIDREAVRTYFQNHPGQSLRISSSDDMGASFVWPEDLQRRSKVFASYPRPEVDEVYITFSLREANKEIEHKVYTVKMATNNVGASGVRASQIVSEVSVGDHVAEMQNFLDTIQQDWMVGRPNVMIYDAGDGNTRSGQYIDSVGRISLTSNWFTEPRLKAENDGFIVFFHEYMHFLMHNLFEKNNSQKNNYAVYEAYQKLLAAAGYKDKNAGMVGQYQQVRTLSDHPVFKILREDAYIDDALKDKQKKISMGHPNDNYRELFASLFTTLRFFPDQFIKNYQGLKAPDKKLVAEVLTMVLTPFGSSVSQLIPEIDKIRQACGCAN